MSEQSVVIDYDYLEAQCRFSDLQNAVKQLSHATEDQFNEIKNEKWFSRVFDLVTLSNKKDIRLANQIENIAQAQQILMEILVRLSERDKAISDLVTEAFKDIEKLSHHDLLLAQKLKKLESQYLFGLNSELKLDDLGKDNATIVSGLLLEASHYYDIPSNAQQEYAQNLLSYLEIQPVSFDVKGAIQSVTSIEDRKLLLQICLEYTFLHELNFKLLDDFEALIEIFEFGNKTIEDLKVKILSHYQLLGKAGFTERYEIEALEEYFFVPLHITEEIIEEGKSPIEDLYVLMISEMVHVAKDDVLVFENKEIHINTFMNIEGKLTFKNCVIHYAEPDKNSQITLNESATLDFNGCRIICHDENERFFIEGKGKNNIGITNCELIHCGYFIILENTHHVTFLNSYVNQPNVNLLQDCSYGDDSEISLSQCQIDFNYYISKDAKNTYSNHSVFNSNSYMTIENCKIDGDELTIKNSGERGESLGGIIEPNFSEYLFLFAGLRSQFKVKHASFNHVKNIFSSDVEISECEFNNCLNIIDSNSNSDEGIVVKNCLFLNCEHMFSGDRQSIKNSQFKDCRNRIVKGREINVEFCEFYNLTNDLSEYNISDGNNFNISCFKDTRLSTISKCIFDGVQIEHNFLIEANTIEKIKGLMVEVKDCEFRNTRTKHLSGIILKEYSSYFGLFNRQKETKPLTYRDCVGLDKINDGAGRAEKVILRGETSTGSKIGIGVAGVLAGIPGLAISIGVSKFLKDDDLTQE